LSPRETGILKADPPKEGTHVHAGELVLQLEDTKAEAELKVAQAELFSAKTKAADDVNIRYSKAAAEVAKNELQFNKDANTAVPGSVPKARLEELDLKVKETTLATEKAAHDFKVADTEAGIAAAKVDAAETMVKLLKVFSPIDGEVVLVRRHAGEAVQPADLGVIHISNRDKLWIKFYVPGELYGREQFDNQPVTVEVKVTGGKKISVPGKVNFVSPQSHQGNNFEVRVEVQRESRDAPWLIHAGMTAGVIFPFKAAGTR
jgi:multidrug efflux pump subunit AcrA (membrane-fusion protein)